MQWIKKYNVSIYIWGVWFLVKNCLFKACFSGLTTCSYKGQSLTWQSLPDSPSRKAAHPTPGSTHSQCTVFSGHHAFCISALLALAPSFLDLFIRVLGPGLHLSLLKPPYVCGPGGGGERRWGETLKTLLPTLTTQYFSIPSSPFSLFPPLLGPKPARTFYWIFLNSEITLPIPTPMLAQNRTRKVSAFSDFKLLVIPSQ